MWNLTRKPKINYRKSNSLSEPYKNYNEKLVI